MTHFSVVPGGFRAGFLVSVLAVVCLQFCSGALAEDAPDPAPESHPVSEDVESTIKSAVAATVTALGATLPDASADVQKQAEEKKAEEEFHERRRQEREQQMASAEEFVDTADRTLRNALPYPLNIFMDKSYAGITLWRYLAAVVLVVAGALFLWYCNSRFRRVARTVNEFGKRNDNALPGETVHVPSHWNMAGNILLLALSRGIRLIVLGLLVRGVSSLLVTAHHPDILWVANQLVFLGIVWYFFDLAGIVDTAYGGTLFPGSGRVFNTVRPMLLKIVRALVLIIAGMQLYHEITGKTMFSVVAGLGIGGIALALASQETLRNLLGFASITFDRAFLVGDPVVIDSYDGTVEHIGLRSMRLRGYDGQSVVIPNNTAINSNIVNLNRRPFIRREMRLALSTKNPIEKIEQAMELMAEVLETHKGKVPGLPPVVRFVDFEPGRFVLQGMFWYDANKSFYLDECSRMNLEVARKLCGAGVLFATTME